MALDKYSSFRFLFRGLDGLGWVMKNGPTTMSGPKYLLLASNDTVSTLMRRTGGSRPVCSTECRCFSLYQPDLSNQNTVHIYIDIGSNSTNSNELDRRSTLSAFTRAFRH